MSWRHLFKSDCNRWSNVYDCLLFDDVFSVLFCRSKKSGNHCSKGFWVHNSSNLNWNECIAFAWKVIQRLGNSSADVQMFYLFALQWRHNERDDVSNQRRLDCLPNHLFRRRSEKTSKLCVTGLCQGNSPVTSEFCAQRSSNTENGFI